MLAKRGMRSKHCNKGTRWLVEREASLAAKLLAAAGLPPDNYLAGGIQAVIAALKQRADMRYEISFRGSGDKPKKGTLSPTDSGKLAKALAFASGDRGDRGIKGVYGGRAA
jgi:hypothetical protein